MRAKLTIAATGNPAPHAQVHPAQLRRVATTIADLFEQFGPEAVIAAAWLVKITNPSPIAVGYLTVRLIDAGIPEGAVEAVITQAAAFAGGVQA